MNAENTDEESEQGRQRWRTMDRATAIVAFAKPLSQSFVNGFVLFANQPGIDITRSPTIRGITSHITKGACLLTGRATLGNRLSTEHVPTITATPLCHCCGLPTPKEQRSHPTI